MFIKFISSFFILLLIACSASQVSKDSPQTSKNDFSSAFNKLEVGQSGKDVKNLLGEPSLREVVNAIEIWHYSQENGRKVEFKEGKVIGFSREAPPQEEKKDLSIGESCLTDKQCQSGNCHFKTCAGKNNCTQLPGQRCATNSDCCSSLCDFGVCKK